MTKFVFIFSGFLIFTPLHWLTAQDSFRTIHAFVALCDNKSQGIVPVPPKIGNGEDLANNLYWGCSDGLKSFFHQSKDWKLIFSQVDPHAAVLERCVFKYLNGNTFLIADAYRGTEIRQALIDFFSATTEKDQRTFTVLLNNNSLELPLYGSADMVAYIGHNGLMDFSLEPIVDKNNNKDRAAVVLCCQSESYFKKHLEYNGVRPLVLTRQFMYPGSFLLKAAIDGWLKKETPEQIKERVAAAYARNQKITQKAARGVFSTW